MKTLATLLLSMTVFTSFSQKKFLPGYIVTVKGDTLKGNIKYANWEKNPKRIEFQNAFNTPTTFGVADITAFEINNEDRYEKFIILKSGRPVDLDRLNEPFPERPLFDTVFLRVVVAGPNSLYELVDNRTYFFLGDGLSAPTELQHWLVPNPQSGDFYTVNTFRDQIANLGSSSGNKKIKGRIATVSYNEQGLAPIIQDINAEQGSVSNTLKRAKKDDLYFFVGSGVNVSNLKFGGSFPEFTDLEYNTSVTPSFRVGVDLGSSRDMQRLIFRTELAYSSLNFTGIGVIKPGSPFEQNIKYDLKVNLISPMFHAIYILEQSKFNGYGGLGLVWNFTNSTNRHVSDYKDGRQEIKDPYKEVQRNWLCLNLKAGMLIQKKFDVNVNYRFGGAFVKYMNHSATASIVGLELNYRFQR